MVCNHSIVKSIVDNHRKLSKPMVAPLTIHSMVMVPLETIEFQWFQWLKPCNGGKTCCSCSRSFTFFPRSAKLPWNSEMTWGLIYLLLLRAFITTRNMSFYVFSWAKTNVGHCTQIWFQVYHGNHGYHDNYGYHGY